VRSLLARLCAFSAKGTPLVLSLICWALGNIRNMIDVSVATNDHISPIATGAISYDVESGEFIDEWGVPQNDKFLSDILGFDVRRPGTGQGGNATLRRNALFKSLLQGEESRIKFLEQLYSQRQKGSAF
jgi:hypothetical protein